MGFEDKIKEGVASPVAARDSNLWTGSCSSQSVDLCQRPLTSSDMAPFTGHLPLRADAEQIKKAVQPGILGGFHALRSPVLAVYLPPETSVSRTWASPVSLERDSNSTPVRRLYTCFASSTAEHMIPCVHGSFFSQPTTSSRHFFPYRAPLPPFRPVPNSRHCLPPSYSGLAPCIICQHGHCAAQCRWCPTSSLTPSCDRPAASRRASPPTTKTPRPSELPERDPPPSQPQPLTMLLPRAI